MIGLGLVIVDIILRRASNGRFSLPPLGVGLAIYLPSTVTAPVVVGAVIGWLYDKLRRQGPHGRGRPSAWAC